MRLFNGGSGALGSALGGLAVCHQGPPHAAELGGGERTAAGVDGGTGILFGSHGSQRSQPQFLDSCRPARRAVEVADHGQTSRTLVLPFLCQSLSRQA